MSQVQWAGVAEMEALASFDTPTIANALETLGITGVQSLEPEVKALTGVARPVVGVAVTATMSEIRGGKFEHLEGWLRFLEAIENTPAPVVAVFHDASRIPGREAMIGEGMSLAMRAAGAAGVIADGCYRDIAALRRIEFPVFGTGLTADRGHIRFHQYQVPVQLPGMMVTPGDFIHADENGALVIPADRVCEILEAAAAVVVKEESLFRVFRDPFFKVEQLRHSYREALTAAEQERRGAGGRVLEDNPIA